MFSKVCLPDYTQITHQQNTDYTPTKQQRISADSCSAKAVHGCHLRARKRATCHVYIGFEYINKLPT